MFRKSVMKFGLGSLVLTGLAACSPGIPRPPGPPLSFTFPALSDPAAHRIAAIYFVGPTTDYRNVKVAGEGDVNSPTSANLYLSSFATDAAAADPNCTTPFKGGETTGKLDVVVTPETVKTCIIFIVVYRDKNGNGQPESGELVYTTNDQYGYASENFTYSYRTDPDNDLTKGVNATETGVRKVGWTVLRHRVIEPEATPGRYKVTMNSVDGEDAAIPIKMHEATDYFRSQGVPAQAGK